MAAVFSAAMAAAAVTLVMLMVVMTALNGGVISESSG